LGDIRFQQLFENHRFWSNKCGVLRVFFVALARNVHNPPPPPHPCKNNRGGSNILVMPLPPHLHMCGHNLPKWPPGRKNNFLHSFSFKLCPCHHTPYHGRMRSVSPRSPKGKGVHFPQSPLTSQIQVTITQTKHEHFTQDGTALVGYMRGCARKGGGGVGIGSLAEPLACVWASSEASFYFFLPPFVISFLSPKQLCALTKEKHNVQHEKGKIRRSRTTFHCQCPHQ
jgi:hypothetical protein